MARSAEPASNRRDQILLEAQRLFAVQGYKETNLNEVAVKLGIRRQALYHYFESKDEILWELTERAAHIVSDAAAPIFAADMSPREKLGAVVHNQVHQVLNNVDLFRIQLDEMERLPGERGKAMRQSQYEYVRQVAGVIRKGQRDGTFVDVPPNSQALLIIGMCNWTLHWYGPQTKLTVDEVATHAARTAVSGVERRDGVRKRRSG
jgi:AcrR family transcriptional regulator